MKKLYIILVLGIIDFLLIWSWIYKIDPDPSISIAVIVYVPFVLIINLIIAGALYGLKKKEYSKLFLINSVIASVLMYYLFGNGIDRYQNNRLESWSFKKSDTTFSLIRWKKTGEFSMSYSLNPGSSWGFLDGKYKPKNNEWILKADSIEMKILEDKLIGFRNPTDTIHMNKIQR